MEKLKNFIQGHKMLVAISALVVIIAIVVAILLISAPEDKLPTSGNNTTVDTSTEESSSSSEDDYLSGIGTAPDDDSTSESLTDKDNADEFPDGSESSTSVNDSENDDSQESTDTTVEPDDKDSEDDTTPSNPSDDDKDSEDDTTPSNPSDEPEEPTHTCNYNTVKYDSSNHWYVCSCGKTANKSAHNYSNEADTTCNTCGHTREVATPEPEKPSTVPSVSWTGPGLVLDNLDITIPTLSHFNSEALTDNTNNTFWTGDSSDTETAQTLGNTLDSVRSALIAKGVLNSVTGQSFALEQYKCSFSYSSYSSTMGLELYRNPLDGTYTLNINYPLDTFVVGVNELAPYNQSVLKVLISMFSSQPEVIFNQLYEDIYGEVCISDTGWTTVGDCKMQFDYDSSYDGHFVYHIKAK